MTEYKLIQRQEVNEPGVRSPAPRYNDREVDSFDSIQALFEFALKHPELQRLSDVRIKAVKNDEEFYLDLNTVFKKAESWCEEGLEEIKAALDEDNKESDAE